MAGSAGRSSTTRPAGCSRTPEFRDLKPVELLDWVDFSVVDEVRAKLGDDESADRPTRTP